MKWKVRLLALPLLFTLTGCPWDDKDKPSDPAKKDAAHDSFVGSPPAPSKPYNIMDYTKPTSKP